VLKRPDPSEGAAVVVLHPGSTNLRVGLATDSAPRVLPHCIAFRRSARGPAAADATAAAAGAADALVREVEPALGLLARQLRLGVQLVGQEFPPVPPTVRGKSGGGRGSGGGEAGRGKSGGADEGARFLVGEAAVTAAHAHPEEWELVRPFKWGTLDLHAGTATTGLDLI
jgi:hypothetical protein